MSSIDFDLKRFLNIRNSTRDLSDEKFDEILPKFAEALKDGGEELYLPDYTTAQLVKDWQSLITWSSNEDSIASANRLGMKLCEHFFPNFYDICDRRGRSFRSCWQDITFLEKVIRWNRSSHSTPYLSELKRGVYFVGGGVATKSTMFRPQLAKLITRGSNRVLDPCCGWGGRMLGAVANGCEYYGFEPNKTTFMHLQNLAKFLGIEQYVHLYNADALTIPDYTLPEMDVVFTSPPYFNLEIYSTEETQSLHNRPTYSDWVNDFLYPLIAGSVGTLRDGGRSCWNVANVIHPGSHPLGEDVKKAHLAVGLVPSGREYAITSSRRQVNNTNKSKSRDTTVEYTHKGSL